MVKPRNDLVIYVTTESTVHSFRLIPNAPSNAAMSAAAAVAATVSSTITSTLRDRRPFQIGQSHQQPSANFAITELESRIGCAPHCAVLTQSEINGEQQFVIGNSTGVFSYVSDDKRLGLGIEGEKLAVHWWFNYLITVSKESRRTPLSPSNVTSTLPTLHKPQSTILNQLTAK